MDAFLTSFLEEDIERWETLIGDWFFVVALGFLAFELLRYGFRRKLNWTLLGDAITNYITLYAYIIIGVFVFGAFYLSFYAYLGQFALFEIQINWMTVAICIVLADLAYYWEHRFIHRVNLGWATHSVHHSSPFFNISVAYRFGPMDDLWPLLFHAPVALIGFNPFVIFFSAMMVQLYQTALHTEIIGKLSKPVEAVMNTPSHHRVHHGSNAEYLDKNYAGIFIIWDRFFGTFEREKAPVKYGLVRPIDSVNPLIVFFHGVTRLLKQVGSAQGLWRKLGVVFGPPEFAGRMPPPRGGSRRQGHLRSHQKTI